MDPDRAGGYDDDRNRSGGSHLERIGDELTWVGDESADELSRHPVIRWRDRLDRAAPYGLDALLALVGLLGALALIGVGLDWFDRDFARDVLLYTVVPSFGAWLLTMTWLRPRPPGGPG